MSASDGWLELSWSLTPTQVLKLSDHVDAELVPGEAYTGFVADEEAEVGVVEFLMYQAEIVVAPFGGTAAVTASAYDCDGAANDKGSS